MISLTIEAELVPLVLASRRVEKGGAGRIGEIG